MPTCNRFDHNFVYHQWDIIKQIYDKHGKAVFGPLAGNSSDGDSRRRKLMFVQLMASSEGERFRPVPRKLGFIFCCEKFFSEGSYYIDHLCDSDYIHCHKKLINHLDHNARCLKMGGYLVHINHLQNLYNVLPPERHGLTRGDVDRTDCQNWWSAQRLSFQQVHECLQEIENEGNGSPQGTRMFLVIVWYYVEIFCSPVAMLKERIKYAAIVCHFLTIWQRWVMRQRGFNTEGAFPVKRDIY